MPTEPAGDLKPPGHIIGFVDDDAAARSFVLTLMERGFSESQVAVFQGEAGIEQWTKMMEGSLWGESTEDVFKDGIAELQSGHSAIVIDVSDSQTAAGVADLARQMGGHGFYHFGVLVDTRLTP